MALNLLNVLASIATIGVFLLELCRGVKIIARGR